ncbi:MAG: glycosyltransferase family protein [Crocinitomicaceae bacterium]|nr:glycosyltransferase family protein [Crocinitomicaceae bacterium]
MGAGLYKIGAIIQARMGSSRFPNKVLMPLPIAGGKSVLEHQIDALKEINQLDEVVIATSSNPMDDAIQSFCEENKIPFFRGDEEDVLSRFYAILKEREWDFVLRLTGDNPVVATSRILELIHFFADSERTYTCTKGLPLGCNLEIFTKEALIDAGINATSDFEKEHVTPFIRNKADHKVFYEFDTNGFENLRLTIDYPSDYAMINLVAMGIKDSRLTLKNVIDFVKENPWVAQINEDNVQFVPGRSLKEESLILEPYLEKMGLTEIKKVIKK